MKHRFDIELSDGSNLFGYCEATEKEYEIKIEISELYHELPMEPDHNGVPCASTLTCLNALIPAIHQFQRPMQEWGAMIWKSVLPGVVRFSK